MKSHPYIDFKGIPRTLFYQKEENIDKGSLLQEKHYLTPTKVIEFIPESTLEDISPIIDRIFIKESLLLDKMEEDAEKFTIPNIVKTKQGYYEEVSDLNGIAIPMMYYDMFINEQDLNCPKDRRGPAGEPGFPAMIEQNLKELKENQHGFLRELIKNVPKRCSSIRDYLYLANIYTALQERLYFRLKQIAPDEYTWLSDDIMDKCRELLQKTVGKECALQKPEIEKTIIHSSDENDHKKIDEFLSQYFPPHEKFRFTARIDMMTDESIWEIKCTSKISIDNLLQVIIYAWLWRMTHEEERIFKILNIKTGELMRLDCTMDELNFIILAIMKGKYSKYEVPSDDEFLFQGTVGSN
jgi:hypothetical protein